MMKKMMKKNGFFFLVCWHCALRTHDTQRFAGTHATFNISLFCYNCGIFYRNERKKGGWSVPRPVGRALCVRHTATIFLLFNAPALAPARHGRSQGRPGVCQHGGLAHIEGGREGRCLSRREAATATTAASAAASATPATPSAAAPPASATAVPTTAIAAAARAGRRATVTGRRAAVTAAVAPVRTRRRRRRRWGRSLKVQARRRQRRRRSGWRPSRPAPDTKGRHRKRAGVGRARQGSPRRVRGGHARQGPRRVAEQRRWWWCGRRAAAAAASSATATYSIRQRVGQGQAWACGRRMC